MSEERTWDRRYGIIAVRADLIKYNPLLVASVFAKLRLVPIRAEMQLHSDAVEYLAWSHTFADCPPEMTIPRYDLHIHIDDDGKLIDVTVGPANNGTDSRG